MDEGAHGLTRELRFVARRLEVVAVAGLLWIPCCVSGAAAFRFLFLFFPSNADSVLHVYRPPCLR